MTISAEQIYLLNNMNSTAFKCQLGTLIQNAESVTAGEIALTDGYILVGNASNVGAAVQLSGEVTITRTGVATVGEVATLKITDTTTPANALRIESLGDGGTPLTADHKLSIDLYNADRTIDLQGNLSITGNATFAGSITTTGAWTQTGAHSIGITTTGNTTITLPTSGTLLSAASATVWTDSQTIDNAKQLKFRELTAGGTNYIGFRAPDALAGDVDYILPSADSAGVFQSNGTGTISIAPLTFVGGHTIALTTTNNTALTLPVSGTLATLAVAEVLENKSLEATCALVDTTDNTKTIKWNLAAQSTGVDLTITSGAELADRILNIPVLGADQTFAFCALAQVLENKSLETTCTIVDATDNTKALGFDVSGMTGSKTLTITPVSDQNAYVKFNLTGSTATKGISFACAATDDRVLTVPDATGTLARISGETYDDIVGLKLRDVTTAAQTLELKSDSTTVLTADRAITFDVVNADRNVEIGGDVVLSSDFKVADQVLYATGTLTQANIVAMNGAAVNLIAACPAGKSIIVDEIEFFHDYAVAAYTGGGDVVVEYSGGTDICMFDSTLVTAGADNYVVARPTIYDLDATTGTAVGFDLDAVDNSGIQITNAVGAFADGNASNIIKWKIKYRVVTRMT